MTRPTIDQVRDEARRRLAVLHRARLGADMTQKVLNSVIDHLTAPSPHTINLLRLHMLMLHASNVLEAALPEDYAGDAHWPSPATVVETGVPTSATVRVQSGAHAFDLDPGRLALLVAVAGTAVSTGVQANDMRWHGGDTDFELVDVEGAAVPMDAPAMLSLGLLAIR